MRRSARWMPRMKSSSNCARRGGKRAEAQPQPPGPNQLLVHLRPAAGDAVEFVLAGDFDHAVLVGERRIDVGEQNRFLSCPCFRQSIPFAIDDLGMTGEGEAALLTHAVRGRYEDVVLGGAHLGCMFPG